MTYTYTDEDFTYPPGVTADDMAWTVISWDLHGPDESPNEDRVRFVLTPGVLLIHQGSQKEVCANFEGPELPGMVMSIKQSYQIPSVGEKAKFLTGWYKGYEVVGPPMMLTLNPAEYPGWDTTYSMKDKNGDLITAEVKTLGDALAHHEDQTLVDVLNAVTYQRNKLDAPSRMTKMIADLREKSVSALDSSITSIASAAIPR